jgi:hypothetical protein
MPARESQGRQGPTSGNLATLRCEKPGNRAVEPNSKVASQTKVAKVARSPRLGNWRPKAQMATLPTAPAPPRKPKTRTLPASSREPERHLRGWLVPNDPKRQCHALVYRSLCGYKHTLCGIPVEPPVKQTHKWTGRCPFGAPSCPECVRIANEGAQG